jgi:murein DD-endopeptidase MepM/ murein hydrolase activator NlpD
LDVVPNFDVFVLRSLFLKTVITRKVQIPAAIVYGTATDRQMAITVLDTKRRVPELLKYSPRDQHSPKLVAGLMMAIGTSSFALLAFLNQTPVSNQPTSPQLVATEIVPATPPIPVMSLQQPRIAAMKPATQLAAATTEPATVVVKKIAAIPIVEPISPTLLPKVQQQSQMARNFGSLAQLPVVVPLQQSSADDFVYPLVTPVPIGSPFGWRVHPVSGKQRLHAGMDFEAPEGAPVIAAIAGRVVIAGWQPGYGKTVVIEQNGKLQTRYGHLSEILVQPGQELMPGTVIGAVGSTGQSTGPHLHFEVLAPTPDGWVAVDPSPGIEYALNNLQQSRQFARRIIEPGS